MTHARVAEDAVDQVRGPVMHAPTQAAWAEPARSAATVLAGKCTQPVVTAVTAPDPGEAMTELAALEVLLELPPHEGGQDPVLLLVERGEAPVVLLDALVKDCLLGSPPSALRASWLVLPEQLRKRLGSGASPLRG